VLATTLDRIGLPRAEIEAILWHEANHARSPKERRAEIRPLLRKLKSSPFKVAA